MLVRGGVACEGVALVRGGVGHKQTSTVRFDAVQLATQHRESTFHWNPPSDRECLRRALHDPAPCTGS